MHTKEGITKRKWDLIGHTTMKPEGNITRGALNTCTPRGQESTG